MFENISPFEVQTPGSGIWKNPGSETLVVSEHFAEVMRNYPAEYGGRVRGVHVAAGLQVTNLVVNIQNTLFVWFCKSA